LQGNHTIKKAQILETSHLSLFLFQKNKPYIQKK